MPLNMLKLTDPQCQTFYQLKQSIDVAIRNAPVTKKEGQLIRNHLAAFYNNVQPLNVPASFTAQETVEMENRATIHTRTPS